MLQLLSLAHGFAAPQPFSGPFWNLASQATGPWDQYWWLCKPRHSPATSRRPARCTFVPDWQWAAIYRTGGNWSGGQKLQYVGYSETADGDASAVGACEEWWFAEGLGVVAIAKFPMLT